TTTLYWWQHPLTVIGARGLAAERTGLRSASKLSQPVLDRIRSLHGKGHTMAQIAARVGAESSTIFSVLTPTARDNTEAATAAVASQNSVDTHVGDHGDTVVADNGADDHDGQDQGS